MSEASLLEFLMSSRSSRTTRQSYDEIQTVLADLHSWAACISWEESPAPWRPPLSRRGCTLHGTSHTTSWRHSETHLVSGRSSACHWSPPSCCQCKILTEIPLFIITVIRLLSPLNLPKASLVVIGRISTLSSVSGSALNMCWSTSGRSDVSNTSMASIITYSRGSNLNWSLPPLWSLTFSRLLCHLSLKHFLILMTGNFSQYYIIIICI